MMVEALDALFTKTAVFAFDKYEGNEILDEACFWLEDAAKFSIWLDELCEILNVCFFCCSIILLNKLDDLILLFDWINGSFDAKELIFIGFSVLTSPK